MNILIIGGAGYIGSHQVRVMCDQDYKVYVLDNLSTGFKHAVDDRATFIEGDVRNYDEIFAVLTKFEIDAVIHFAALSLVGVSVTAPLEYYNNNLYGMEVLLTAMKDSGVDKIVFSSTAATYGEQDVMPITEKHQENPTNPYGETKLAMEKMIKWCEKAYGIKYISLRYFNACGSILDGTLGENHDPETHLIPLVLQAAMGVRDSISIFGTDYDTKDGTCIRDYIHVLDLCQAHTLAIKALVDGAESNIYNLGYGEGYSVLDIIDTTEKVVDKKIKREIAPRRAGDPAMLIASCDLIKQELGWEPEYNDLELIIKSAYAYFNNK